MAFKLTIELALSDHFEELRFRPLDKVSAQMVHHWGDFGDDFTREGQHLLVQSVLVGFCLVNYCRAICFLKLLQGVGFCEDWQDRSEKVLVLKVEHLGLAK